MPGPMPCPRRLGKVFQQLITCWPSTHILRNLGQQRYAGMSLFLSDANLPKSQFYLIETLDITEFGGPTNMAHVVVNNRNK